MHHNLQSISLGTAKVAERLEHRHETADQKNDALFREITEKRNEMAKKVKKNQIYVQECTEYEAN